MPVMILSMPRPQLSMNPHDRIFRRYCDCVVWNDVFAEIVSSDMLCPTIGLFISRMHAQIDCLPFCNSVFLQCHATSDLGRPFRDRERPAFEPEVLRNRQIPEEGEKHRHAGDPVPSHPQRQGREGQCHEPVHHPLRVRQEIPARSAAVPYYVESNATPALGRTAREKMQNRMRDLRKNAHCFILKCVYSCEGAFTSSSYPAVSAKKFLLCWFAGW